MVNLKKKLRKASKKAKKSVDKATDKVTQEVKETAKQTTNTVTKEVTEASKEVKQTANTVAEEVTEASKKVVKYGGKTFNQVTGAIEESVDKAIDYTKDDLKTAVKYAEKKWNQGADWVEDLAKDAINEAYRAVYKQCVGDYIKFVAAIVEAQTKIFSNDTNILTEIRNNLVNGQFSKSMDNMAELVESDVMKKSVEAGHKLFGTSFIVAADLSVGVTTSSSVTFGGGGAIGLTYMLDHYNSYKHKACVFTALGGSIGASTSQHPSVSGEIGLSLGFLAQDPTNISGWFVDVSGQGEFDNSSMGLGLSWAPPGKKPPYVKPIPVAGVTRLGFSASRSLSAATASPNSSASATIGGSYTWIIQKIKNDRYLG
ncbi:MAG: hypothetical protein AAFR31_18780 [Cyanobacteria bacterium J06627_8]